MADLPPALSQTFNRAILAFNAGKFSEAEQLCQQIIVAKEDFFDALHLLAVVQSTLGKNSIALAAYDRALIVWPGSADALLNRGNALHRLRQFEEALTDYDSALTLRPDYAEALYNRGNTLQELKRFEEALASYDRALTLRPDFVEALCNRGNTLQELKRFEEALASYDRALTLRPEFAEALCNRGNTLKELKRFEEALASYDRALTLRPEFAEALCYRGNTLKELKRLEEALASYDRALTLRPEFAEALSNRGVALHELKRFAEALTNYDRALVVQPNFAEAHSNRGVVLHELKRFAEALTSYDRALTLRPDYAEAFYNRGNALQQVERFEEALASYDRALSLRQNYAEALSNRGNTLKELAWFDEALASCDRALAIRPDYSDALLNRGVALHELNRFEEELASYDRVLALQPDHADARFNAAVCLLLIGDFDRGWREYEWRWVVQAARDRGRAFRQPLWRGEADVKGKTVLIHSEQGLGDTIQFCRFATLVTRRGARVILEVQPELKSLMSSLNRGITVIAQGDEIPKFDCHTPLMSLPFDFKTTLADIPKQTSYLFAPKRKTRAWRKRLDRQNRPRVGLVWAGSPRHGQPAAKRLDRQRSIAFDQLAPLFQTSECEFYSLQKGDDAVMQLRRSPLRQCVIDWTDELYDFSDTAALIENLDLIITVDTAVAHLAGALGKSFWLINRYNTCWRWLLDREDSPWYPTARIFRQPRWGDWAPIIGRIARELRIWSYANQATQ